MRHYDIARVGGGTVVGYPAKSLQDMSFEEIQSKYLKMCAKANGNVSICSKCPTPCTEGKRAIQLLANEVYDDPPIPLYGGKTLIEKAREENMLRRQRLEQEKQMKTKKSKDNRVYIEDWYDKAMASEDPAKWVQEAYGIDRNKAKAKLCQWRNRHKDAKETKPVKSITEEKPVKSTVPLPEGMETKLERLYNEKELIQKNINNLQKQLDKAKKEYEDINHKIDVLCSAMDIMNE